MKRYLSILAGVGLIGVLYSASASVTQVDGVIVPVGNALQGFLDTEEGVSSGPNRINAVLDAFLVPEIFLPDVSKNVTIKDIAEGAGFENTFGYYNVGDDITCGNNGNNITGSGCANLHPILGCTIGTVAGAGDLTHHGSGNGGDAAGGYVSGAEPGTIATINFNTELAQGRYKGGFIGFYLITPEANPSDNNNACGDNKHGTDGKSLFGKIYFTQRDLNNDGDFVHTLIYNSKLVSDRFYFGAEDLFRGGDNDYEDMATQVNGLTPPCVPVNETCNGKDDDCDCPGDTNGDGLFCRSGDTNVDENTSDVGDACVSGIGSCAVEGATVCTNGVEVCGAVPNGPTQELCNNGDDDCNGVIDNAPADVGSSCTVGAGTCARTGVTVCSGGFELCGAVPGSPNGETCNSLDDDCDGLIDEDFGVGNSCDGIGACGPGALECKTTSSVRCSTDVGGSQDQSTAELCDNIDNDCDGQIDDATTNVGLACTAGLGACLANGVTICANGGPVCNANPGQPTVELCNGIDDDCDGVIDNGFNIGLACDGVGACGPGALECASPTATRCSTDIGGSQNQASAETCDLLDNDCDGFTDEGLNDLGACGLFPNVGECLDGRLRCSVGQIECVGEVGPTNEFCDGLDNDCDGTPDDNVIDDGGPCGSNFGECRQGNEVCFGGALLCAGETPPSTELCDNKDNDCDGILDNNLNDPLVNVSCGTDTGECDFGATICTAGLITCFGGNGPQTEVCDGLDNDCDNIVDGSDINGDGLADGLDLDGDGVADITTADAGQLCGNNSSSNPLCSAGINVCQADPNDTDGDGFLGEIVCEGGNAGVGEVCNGIDDDCDNVIDDSPTDPELGLSCGNDFGACVPGVNRCVAGQIICEGGVGPSFEICNGIDDDCDCPNEDTNGDGIICGIGDFNVDEVDTQPLCEDPAVCALGDCRLPCDLKTAHCAGGEICLDETGAGGFCIPDPCIGVNCTAPDVCNPFQGTCQLPCEINPCSNNFVCDPASGECLENNCYGLGCPDGELCLDAQCTPDLCANQTCAADEFCRDGQCVKSCENVACAPQQKCVDGACVDNLCFGVTCQANERCIPETGQCSDACRNVDCGDGRVCNPADGSCVDDPCTGIDCSDSARCVEGQCISENGTTGFITGGGAGCAVTPGEGRAPVFALAMLSLLLVLSSRRRYLSGVLLFLQGCILDPFSFINGETCEVTQNGVEFCDLVDNDCDGVVDDNCAGCLPSNNGIEACDGADNDCNGFVDENCQNQTCSPTNNGVEKCDGVDNDCDTIIDDGFDLTTDFRNCGECSRACNIAGAFSSCAPDPQDLDGNGFLAECVFDGCAPGNIDLDPTDNDPRCTYECTKTNGGIEDCDDIDNDCDGEIDEDFDFDNDESNCGECGNVCAFFQATPTCSQGQCVFDPASDCLTVTDPNNGQQTQFHDIDGDLATGCEYPCNPNPVNANPSDPETLCNGLDDDCDGVRDDGLNLDNDVNNCGGCGRACSFPNVINPSCSVGQCQFDPATDCAAGAHDIDGNAINGCEYLCNTTNNGVEICDGLDNDCDGQADEASDILANDPTLGLSCGAPNVGTCQAGASTCIAGTVVCVGAIGPRNEKCDGLDNDCNGTIDDAAQLTDVGRVCANAVGECTLGLTACTAGALVCVQQQGPTPELCDGLDNDCDGIEDGTDTNGDGLVDLLPSDVSQPCGGGTVNGGTSQCQEGITTCSLGTLQCVGDIAPSNETCDNVDNDCDGQVDDNPAQVGLACGTNLGECNQGTFACVTGNLQCQNNTGPSPELCDGLDNDCTGIPDDNIVAANDPRIGVACGASAVGACDLGAQQCIGGIVTCVGEIGPITESCNATDDDCDGSTDESLTQACYSGPNGTNGVGRCRGGLQTCTAGAFAGACVGEVLPATESCNAIDDDCDSAIDEANGGGPLTQSCYTGPGGTLNVGICRAGTQTCQGGAFLAACEDQVLPDFEICGDSLNNDCDANASDSSEGCVAGNGGELRLDSATGAAITSSAGQHHNTDADIAVQGNNVYVAFSDNRISSGTNARNVLQVFLARSTDSGTTFNNTLVRISDNTNRCDTDGANGADGLCAATSARVMAFPNGASDVVVVSYIQLRGNQTRDVFLSISRNSGATFSTPVRLDADNDTKDAFHFDVAGVKSGSAVKFAVAWEELDTGTLSRVVKVRRTKNAENATPTIDAEQTANKGAGAQIAGRPKLVFGNSDRIISVWREQRSGAGFNGTTDIFSNFWDDAQASINATDLRLDTDSGANTDDLPVIARLGSEVYVAWQDIKSDGSDITFVRSTNNATAFGAEQTIDDPGQEVSSSLSPAIFAQTVSAQNKVYLAWADDRDGSEIFVARSTNGGISFTGGLRASSIENPVPGVSLDAKILADASNRVYVAFSSDRSGFEDIFVGFSIDDGAFFQPFDVRADQDTAGAAPSILPAMALLSSGIAVVWQDFRGSGTINANGDIYFRRVTP